jgi:hypothetical protein
MKENITTKRNLQKLPYVSKFGLLTVVTFIILSLLARLLFPFGDEPDFSVRAPALIFTEHSAWIPYFYLDFILEKLDYTSNCQIISSPFSLTATIDSNTCIQEIEQVLLRLLLMLIVISPLLYAIVFRRSFVFLARLFYCKSSAKEWTERLDTLSLALLFPGLIYYLGVLSMEQFTLLLSLLVFLFWRGVGLVIILTLLIFSIDKGNSLVVMSLVILNWLSLRVIQKISLGKYFFIVFLAASGFFAINFLIIEYLSYFAFLQNKIAALMNKYSSGVTKKYPLVLRPAITYMTFISLTPAYVKAVGAYLATTGILMVSIIRVRYFVKNSQNKLASHFYKFKISIILAVNSIIVILAFIFILPDYANGKYYIFMLPFIFQIFLKIYNKKHIYIFMLMLNSLVLWQLYSYLL